jgi:hypothetical protein
VTAAPLRSIDRSAPGAEPDVTSTVLFSGYEIKADLPAASSEKNIDVPAEAKKGPAAPEGSSTIVP